MEVGVESAIAISAIAILHGIAGDVDFAGIHALSPRISIVGYHVMHAVEADPAIRAVVVFKDDFLRPATEDRPVAWNSREFIARNVS